MTDLHVSAVVDHLTAGGVLVGRGVKPAGGGWPGAPGQSGFTGYAILWRIGSLDLRSDDVTDGFDDHRPLMFVRCFGGSDQEASVLMDAVRDRMLRVPLEVPGHRVLRVWLENSQTTTKSETVEVGLFEAGDFYRVWTSPVTEPAPDPDPVPDE